MTRCLPTPTHLQAYSERLTRAAIAQWPDGVYDFEDVIELVEGDEVSLVPIRVSATHRGDEVTFDFTGTAPVMHGSLNAVIAIAQSACYYVVRCLVGDEVPMNGGCFAPVHVVAPVESVVNAGPPAAVAGGNVETSQRITDVVLGALAQALPEQIPAASQGTMNNVTIGGQRANGAPYRLLRDHRRRHGREQRERRPKRRPGAHDEHAQHARRGAGAGLSLSAWNAIRCARAAAAAGGIAAATASCANTRC